uniref:CBS domain-containing protein n=1 Tax=Globodera pallida TaxID=36090 RepID=A0A183CDT4_GLOPA
MATSHAGHHSHHHKGSGGGGGHHLQQCQQQQHATPIAATPHAVPSPILCPAMAPQPIASPPLPPRPSPLWLAPSSAEEVTEDLNMAAVNTTTGSSSCLGGRSSRGPPLTQLHQFSLPSPQEMAPVARQIPPEMERETNRWRQYAAAALLHGRKGMPPKGLDEDDEEFRGRRMTVTYRFPTATNGGAGGNSDQTAAAAHHYQQIYRRPQRALRQLSMGHQRHSADERAEISAAAEEAFAAMVLNNGGNGVIGEEERRLYLQERSLLSANYAILRKSVDRFEVVGAFHRFHTEAYRHFLQSLTCYDLSPAHGLLVMLDAELTIQKAVQILVAHPAPRVAIISNVRDGLWAMFTVTDCLRALQRAHQSGNIDLGGRTLRYFVEQLHGGRRLISVDDQSSVWDLARVFSLNRVHRVPVFSAENGELMAVLCPRAICVELLKLISSKCSLSPDLSTLALSSCQVGTWGEIASIDENESCARAVDLFLDRQVSALPVLSSAAGALLGVVDKNNLLDKLFDQLGAQPTPERCMELMAETPVKDLLPPFARRRTVQSNISVTEALTVLAKDGLSESLFVLDTEGQWKWKWKWQRVSMSDGPLIDCAEGTVRPLGASALLGF